MFQRLESVLNSEIRSLGHPCAALLGFAVAVLAHNVLVLLQHCVELAHQEQKPPEVSTYHLALPGLSHMDLWGWISVLDTLSIRPKPDQNRQNPLSPD